MADHQTQADPTADRLAELNVAGAIPMTAEEVLAGATQGGVPRPACLRDNEDDGTVHVAKPGDRP